MTEMEIMSVLIANLPFLKAVILAVVFCMVIDSLCNVVKLFQKEGSR